MDKKIKLEQGGIYLGALDPAKHAEIGKIRPVIILSAPLILQLHPGLIFICPLSSKSNSNYSALHVELPLRERLEKNSYALIEHCQAISVRRIKSHRMAQLNEYELSVILSKLKHMVGL